MKGREFKWVGLKQGTRTFEVWRKMLWWMRMLDENMEGLEGKGSRD